MNKEPDTGLLKDYIDTRMEALQRYVDSNLTSDRKAVDQYSKTNDEWKALHNDLQRKLQDDRNAFVTKEQLEKQTQLIWSRVLAVLGFVITIYQVFFKD